MLCIYMTALFLCRPVHLYTGEKQFVSLACTQTLHVMSFQETVARMHKFTAAILTLIVLRFGFIPKQLSFFDLLCRGKQMGGGRGNPRLN